MARNYSNLYVGLFENNIIFNISCNPFLSHIRHFGQDQVLIWICFISFCRSLTIIWSLPLYLITHMNFIHILIVKKTIFSFFMVIVIILLHSRTVFLTEYVSAYVEFAVQINFFIHTLKILRIISGYFHGWIQLSADKFLNCLFISLVAKQFDWVQYVSSLV